MTERGQCDWLFQGMMDLPARPRAGEGDPWEFACWHARSPLSLPGCSGITADLRRGASRSAELPFPGQGGTLGSTKQPTTFSQKKLISDPERFAVEFTRTDLARPGGDLLRRGPEIVALACLRSPGRQDVPGSRRSRSCPGGRDAVQHEVDRLREIVRIAVAEGSGSR